MNTAKEIASLVQGASAITFLHGYAVFHDRDRILFEPGKELKVRRTSNGRCTYAEFKYKDGSILKYSWNERDGMRINT